ncbi:Tfa1p [Sugiyamaella lignohabitans]|uniref:Tfa1p n=1 Tax=Sugiyamaella lignohabitans TaxID=796027 RepID=A0A167C3T4_9ASCO|nr:Tfa1p [Sugiyamaella lignohabitans]ANB11182.1 Tfa1p [Sugiyamaella lignohabitans]
MDALLIHGVLTDDELWHMLGINKKELRALCAKLKENHLLTDHVQREEGPAQRPITKTYYYIHYTETIDAIKWKMHSIVKKLKEEVGAESQPQGYVCDTCKSRYATIDVIGNFNSDRGGFVCDVCDSLLREDDSSAESQAQQEKLGRLMSQIDPIIDALRQIDEVHIPENTFQSSLAHALPAPSSTGPTTATTTSSAIKFAKSANQGGVNGTTSLQVNITSDKESAEIERKNREERARLAEENALPTWHLESTVGKSLYDSTNSSATSGDKMDANAPILSDRSTIKLEDSDKPATSADNIVSSVNSTTNSVAEDKASEEALASYYAQLAARQEASDDEDEDDEEDEDEDEDDDAEFEDVITADVKSTIDDEDDDDDED